GYRALWRAAASLLFLLSLVGPVADARTHNQPTSKLPIRGEAQKESPTRAPDLAGPISIPNAQIEPVSWSDLDGWANDDEALAFTAFLTSCRPMAKSAPPPDASPMYLALRAVCRRAIAMPTPDREHARAFFEDNFRPVRIAKLGENSGLLTGYYEPVVA